jgi:Coenzyme PQQ synthesis protein D (PqqD)
MENPLARRNDIVMQDVSDELLIYDLLNDKAYCLNRSAALVWKFCDGTNAISDIAHRFEKAADGSVGEDFVRAALGQLDDSGLLAGPASFPHPRRSRRQALKAIGATAVALPLVATLVVPAKPLGSLSCDGCVNPGQCLAMPNCPSTMNCNPLGMCAPNPVPRAET